MLTALLLPAAPVLLRPDATPSPRPLPARDQLEGAHSDSLESASPLPPRVSRGKRTVFPSWQGTKQG